MNLLGSFLLTATAVAPVLIAYAIVALIEQDILSCIVIISITIVLVILCFILLRLIRNKQAPFSLSITAVDSADRESLGLMVLYLMPLIGFRFSELDWRMLAPAIVLFLSLVVTGTSYHFNPLFNCLGWHFYKVDTKENVKYLLITKKRLRNVNSPISVVELSKYTLMEK